MTNESDITSEARAARRRIAKWRKDPIKFVRDVFNVEPDAWQKDFLNNYIEWNRSGAKACKGPGKTCVEAWCAWHFLVCFPHCKIAATSITGDNLRDNLWAEMAKWQMKSPMLQAAYRWSAEKIVCVEAPETWFMVARKWSKDATGEQQANALAGLHADYILFIIDEAGGVPDAVMAAAEAVLANAGTEVNPNAIAKIIICGNPTHLTGPLYRACTKEASLWRMIEITGDPDDPKRSPRISIQWAREQIKKYGADNSWVLVNVFGKFPPSSINALVGPDAVEAAMKRVLRPEVWMRDAKVLAVDVALQGDDTTVITPRQGMVIFKQKVLRLSEPKQIAGVVARAIKKFEPDAVFIDNTGGWGSGVISHLRDWGYTVTGVQFAGKSDDPDFVNKRSEMHFRLAEFIKDNGALPDDPELKEEICAQTYFHAKDRLQMTEKDQVKEELGRSPDKSDSAALTFAFPVQRRNIGDEYRQKRDNEYNPLSAMEQTPKEEIADYNPLALYSPHQGRPKEGVFDHVLFFSQHARDHHNALCGNIDRDKRRIRTERKAERTPASSCRSQCEQHPRYWRIGRFGRSFNGPENSVRGLSHGRFARTAYQDLQEQKRRA